MDGDMKGHGFDLETSHLRQGQRLARLTLAVCLLYLWLVALAEYVIHHKQTREIDPANRQDLSVFRLGVDFLERRLSLDDSIPAVFVPNFRLVSGG